MIKNNKWKLLITSLIVILPMVIGLILWNELPEKIATHWDAEGKVNGWSSKTVAVFVIPIFLLVVHWICVFATNADPKNRDQTKKAMGLVLWICPIVSLFVNGMIYGVALGAEIRVELLAPLVMGVMFIVLGNYLPKCKQNHTIGIKVSWTLNDEENWNRTHRFAGKIWLMGGVLILFSILMSTDFMMMIIYTALIALIIVPLVYSYMIYRKKMKNGE